MKVDIYVHQGQLVVPLDQVNALIKAANPLGNINTDPNCAPHHVIKQRQQFPQGETAFGSISQNQQPPKISELEKQAQINHGY